MLRQVAAPVSFSGRVVFVACWWARLIIESTETVQSIPSIECAWAGSCARTVSQVVDDPFGDATVIGERTPCLPLIAGKAGRQA